MAKEIRFGIEDGQHERLNEIKQRRGLTWKGLLIHGAECIEGHRHE